MRPKETPKLVERLRDEGPLPGVEVGGVSVMSPGQRRRFDVRRFDIVTKAPGCEGVPSNRTRMICYLHEEHDPATVLDAWLDENRAALEVRDVTKTNVARGVEGMFQEVWQEIRDDYDWIAEPDHDKHGGDGTASQETCPLCGADLDDNGLPAHLPDCDGGDA